MVMAHLGGKLLVFQSSAPSLGIGKIKNRDVANLYNTGGCRVQGLGFKPIFDHICPYRLNGLPLHLKPASCNSLPALRRA